MTSPFEEMIGHEIKAPYKDGSQYKIARGVLKDINNGFVKVVGRLGTIIINEKNIERMARVSENRRRPNWKIKAMKKESLSLVFVYIDNINKKSW